MVAGGGLAAIPKALNSRLGPKGMKAKNRIYPTFEPLC